MSTPRHGQSRAARPRPRLEALEDRLLLTTYTVTNANDSGPGSLRQAILSSNANPGPNTIAFGIGTGAVFIDPLSPLPVITSPVLIDGSTQPGFTGSPLIDLYGASAGVGSSGLEITAANTTVKKLVVNGFSSDGVFLQTNGTSPNTADVLTGDYIGTDLAGTTAVGNANGVRVATNGNLIGLAGAGNVIAGNHGDGVFLATGAGNVVQGNSLGTNAAGTAALANGTNDIEVGGTGNTIGGTAAGAGNVIAASPAYGVYLYGRGN